MEMSLKHLWFLWLITYQDDLKINTISSPYAVQYTCLTFFMQMPWPFLMTSLKFTVYFSSVWISLPGKRSLINLYLVKCFETLQVKHQ